ncbi:response regulator transcription factor [Polaribacter sp.]|uniref:response regulator transcription factor n=1 Tax=Polaribacter sp. TaxID=1920175 RepID=UPI004047F679
MSTKVIIIEDELFVAMHLRKLISSLGYHVVSFYHSVEDFIEDKDCEFDIAFIDVFLEGKMTGIDAAKYIKQQKKPFIFLTANRDSQTINDIAELSPAAYLSKPFQEIEVEAALKILSLKNNSDEKSNIDPFYIFLNDNNYSINPLTLREIDVLKSVCLGLTSDIISEKLFISKNTVKTHLHNLCKKFSVKSKSDLTSIVNNIFNK